MSFLGVLRFFWGVGVVRFFSKFRIQSRMILVNTKQCTKSQKGKKITEVIPLQSFHKCGTTTTNELRQQSGKTSKWNFVDTKSISKIAAIIHTNQQPLSYRRFKNYKILLRNRNKRMPKDSLTWPRVTVKRRKWRRRDLLPHRYERNRQTADWQ